MSSPKTASLDTLCIHGGQENDPLSGAVMPPIVLSSTFAQDGPGVHKGYDYSRAGNPTRWGYEDLLRREWKQRARGELGWSAELRKSVLFRYPAPGNNQPKWRDYACESFCDTAAWLYSGIARHREFTLAERHRKRRKEWFLATFQGRQIPI